MPYFQDGAGRANTLFQHFHLMFFDEVARKEETGITICHTVDVRCLIILCIRTVRRVDRLDGNAVNGQTFTFFCMRKTAKNRIVVAEFHTPCIGIDSFTCGVDMVDAQTMQNAACTCGMVFVCMTKEDSIDMTNAAVKEKGNIDLLADIEGTVPRTAGIEKEGMSFRRHDEGSVALSHRDEVDS